MQLHNLCTHNIENCFNSDSGSLVLIESLDLCASRTLIFESAPQRLTRSAVLQIVRLRGRYFHSPPCLMRVAEILKPF